MFTRSRVLFLFLIGTVAEPPATAQSAQAGWQNLQSRRKPVLGVRFSADGAWLASISLDTISVWDLASGLQARTIPGKYHGGPDAIAVRRDADSIAAVTQDGKTAKFWDPRSGSELPSVAVNTADLSSPPAFSADGRFVAAQDGDGCCAVRVWDLASGVQVQALPGHFTGISAVGFTPEGRLLAAGSLDGTVKIWEVASGRKLRPLDLNGIVTSVVFSPDGRNLATTSTADEKLRIWDVGTGQELHSFASPPGNSALAFSPDGRLFAAYGATDTIQLWDVATWKPLPPLSANTAQATALSFSPDGRYLAAGTGDGTVSLWDMPAGDQVLSLISSANGMDWMVVAPDGLFDGSPGSWEEIAWRSNKNAIDVVPMEIFFNEYFRPELLADIFRGMRPKASTDINRIDRRQPAIAIETSTPFPSNAVVSARTIKMQIRLTEAPADKDHPRGGAQDVRLFRNGSLVRVWHGDVLQGRSSVPLEATVALVAGKNQFTAYCFNRANIKSRDATVMVTGADSLKRQGKAYILAIGVNHYADSSFDLNYAVADAQGFAQELKAQQENLGIYQQVKVIPLYDANATKDGILGVFSVLKPGIAGAHLANTQSEPALTNAIQPEDTVFVFFAGHGIADGARFYLVPHDLGYQGGRNAADEAALKTIEQHSISDEALDRAFEGIDAGRIVLVIDACNSGKALEAEEWRRGPMNSKGLAQLAYEKGMYIVTAARGDQEAMEISRLGHGLLTYALIEEGLRKGSAGNREGVIYLRDWLDYAQQEVPRLQWEWFQGELNSGRGVRVNRPQATDPSQLGLQRPRIFYRRESEAQPIIVGQRSLVR